MSVNHPLESPPTLVELEAFAPNLALPAGARVPFGWKAAAVDRTEGGTATRFRYTAEELPRLPDDEVAPLQAYLRFTVAIDVREEKRIRVVLDETDEEIGVFDIRYAYTLQIFEVPLLDKQHIREVLRQGVRLEMVKGELPLWFLTNTGEEEGSGTLLPHLLMASADSAGADRLWKQLTSLASVQPFGWMEGCVLDALLDLKAARPSHPMIDSAIERHLRLFLTQTGELVYENARSIPVDGTIYGIEGTLPFAAIAKWQPDHPVLDLALDFWLSARKGSHDRIADGEEITAEGAYTIAYPLAVLAKERGREDLARLAVSNLHYRIRALRHEQGICWIYPHTRKGERYVNWARAYAWYMLGLIRTLTELEGMSPDLPEEELLPLRLECVRIAATALSLQRNDGLWHCMLHEPETGIDTSGSAGIAAAIAIGANHGVLPEAMRDAAHRAYEGLLPHVRPDGLLGGVAQSNRNGEELQRSGYRVLSQMAMGLMGQLSAAIGR